MSIVKVMSVGGRARVSSCEPVNTNPLRNQIVRLSGVGGGNAAIVFFTTYCSDAALVEGVTARHKTESVCCDKEWTFEDLKHKI